MDKSPLFKEHPQMAIQFLSFKDDESEYENQWKCLKDIRQKYPELVSMN